MGNPHSTKEVFRDIIKLCDMSEGASFTMRQIRQMASNALGESQEPAIIYQVFHTRTLVDKFTTMSERTFMSILGRESFFMPLFYAVKPEWSDFKHFRWYYDMIADWSGIFTAGHGILSMPDGGSGQRPHKRFWAASYQLKEHRDTKQGSFLKYRTSFILEQPVFVSTGDT